MPISSGSRKRSVGLPKGTEETTEGSEAGPYSCASNPLGMERAEAEAVYEQGRETVVAVLLELAAQNALLRREVAELSERLAKQEERIAELERRLKRNSRNSSLPPSQDPPAAPERRQAAPSGRGRGA